jgi:SAM-dependent methyltransferase
MDPDAEALAAVLDCVQDSMRDRDGGVATLEGRPEIWGFVSAGSAFALEQLRLARRSTSARSPRLLECGSGYGFVGALAREVGFGVMCIEVVPRYVEASRRLFPSVRVLEVDLATFDDFGGFDVVYYYRPFADASAQERFELRIEDVIRPGGIVIARGKVSDAWKRSGAFRELAHSGAVSWTIQKV